MISPTITPQQLQSQLDEPQLVLLDASIPKVTGGTSDLVNRTIPGALVVNLKKDFSNPEGSFPNTIPTIEQFAATCNRLGITNDSKIVVFDNLGVYSSPRVWWLFKTMGHEHVQVLDGGLPAWVEAGYKTIERDFSAPLEISNNVKYTATSHSENVVFHNDVLANIETKQFTIVDARSKGRFDGTAPEPRKELQSGCMPNSVNVPYQEVLNGYRYKSKGELQQLFANLAPSKEMVFSCGSGLTACIVLLAAQIAKYKSMKVYDGSWTEWASLQGLKTNL